jgi:hypothetical protein
MLHVMQPVLLGRVRDLIIMLMTMFMRENTSNSCIVWCTYILEFAIDFFLNNVKYTK